jgi:thiol-disulfide isomerase/thioredoxin
VLVRPETGTPKRWAIGKEDHLPRRMEMLLEGGGIKGRFVYELTNVTANPPLTPEDADIAYPEGYIKNEAPPPPPPPPPGNDPAATATPGARTGPEAPAAPVKVVGAAVGNIAPDFELTRADLDGKGEEKVRLSALRGRAVVLEFGGSWNARSRAGHPELKALAERFRDKPVTIATVSVREKDPAKPVEYMKQNAYPWALLLAGDEAAKLYRVRVYPTYFVITPDGDIAHVALDYEKGKTLTKVEQLLDLFSADAPATPAGEAPKPSSDGG